MQIWFKNSNDAHKIGRDTICRGDPWIANNIGLAQCHLWTDSYTLMSYWKMIAKIIQGKIIISHLRVECSHGLELQTKLDFIVKAEGAKCISVQMKSLSKEHSHLTHHPSKYIQLYTHQNTDQNQSERNAKVIIW